MKNNNNIKVSVVIPVYNTEKYIRQTVESIMSQTLKELEIIIINDGSTDESLKIIKALALLDNRIQFYSQPNQGPSVTRNAGITHSHGKYLYFMDSDDLLETDTLEICYQKCEEDRLDFVFFDACCFYDNDLSYVPQLSYQRTDKMEDKIYNGIEALKFQLENEIFTPSACLNFISTSFLKKCDLHFYPGILHEDQLFSTLLYLQAERTACIRRSFFQRRLRNNSIMTCKFSTKNLKSYLIVVHELLQFKKQTREENVGVVIDLHLSQMLNAVVWQAHTLPFRKRIQLAIRSLFQYKRYISIRSIGVLLFKSLIHQQSKSND
ncbi:glycosyltransferase [Bacteroides sp.]|uniref:glycosyltransferase family 2 protein n=1 Tax=Bacteroides sp. TaxID=29523 RepID=UPI002606F844|nr:glycosyltransferase [Bacteroides sp.]MDD3037759.1 glycosyltransferase [Bacteroides sp.]